MPDTRIARGPYVFSKPVEFRTTKHLDSSAMSRPREAGTASNGNGRERQWRALARKAGLKYVCDGEPGIQRRRAGRGFCYCAPSGRAIRDVRRVARCEGLGIPPAWSDVWICPETNGHLQATGRDSRGRKQYLYHERWRAATDSARFSRLLQFGKALSRLRAQVELDLAARGLSQRKVTALVARLLDLTAIRVGSAEYARDNGTYGLTTLRNRHVRISGPRIQFTFPGKGGKPQLRYVHCRRLATLVRRCKETGGPHLFQYLIEDEYRAIDSATVNEYLQAIHPDHTAKDFRTWHATACVSSFLAQEATPKSLHGRKRALNSALSQAADLLGNTRAVCRKHYVHTGIMDEFLEGEFTSLAAGFKHRRSPRLTREEQFLVHVLRRLEQGQKSGRESRRAAAL